MEDVDLFTRFGVALLVGVMVGLQREYSHERPEEELPAGIRTFSILGLMGCASAMLCDILHSPWALFGTMVIVGAYFTVSYLMDAKTGRTGLTTKVAALLTLLIGALAYFHHLPLAVALGVILTLILSLKVETHSFARHMTKADVVATLKFAVITAIVLPVLPNQSLGPPPFDVLNPLKIWIFVVLISAISYVGYLLMKVAGPNKGIWLTGVLGGIISSTGVTLSFTQRSRECPELSKAFAFAILTAWAIMFARVMIIVGIINFSIVPLLWGPVCSSMLVLLPYCWYLYRSQKHDGSSHEVSFVNPFELSPAIKFGMIFTLVLLVAKAAQLSLGTGGIYLSSFFSGLADVDAIVLSVTKFSYGPKAILPQVVTWAILIASVANTLLKGGVVLISGSPGLKKAIFPGICLILLVCFLTAYLMLPPIF